MHIYEKDGEKFPSITTVISLISTNEDLMKWANFLGFKHKDLNTVQKEYTSFGTKVHSVLQREVDSTYTEQINYAGGIEKYRIEKVLTNFKNNIGQLEYKTIFSEKTIISPELGYAGTLDWLCEFDDGIISLNDFKTSKKIKPYMFLQLGGYYNLLQTINQRVDMAMIIICNERECGQYPINKETLEYYGMLFNKLYEFYILWSKHTLNIDTSIIKAKKQKVNIE